MFSWFLNEFYYFHDINKAFKLVCADKLLFDGYVDMNKFIHHLPSKNVLLSSLSECNPKYLKLYQMPLPLPENAFSFWSKTINLDNENEDMTFKEAEAIVMWIFKIIQKEEHRKAFVEIFFKNAKDLFDIKSNVKIEKCIVYNSKKISIKFISNINSLNDILVKTKIPKTSQLFFRGHSNVNYRLHPSILRSKKLEENEHLMYNEIIINCPDSFDNCHTHLEKLVKMQHYGVPTRLLDITRNPLVALYFACLNNHNQYGEIVLIEVDRSEIKYPQSDTATILASLPLFSFKDQRYFNDIANTCMDDDDFNKKASRLLHEIKLEKPAFQAEIKRTDVLNNFVVYTLKNNNRIIKQDGAFIICGLENKGDFLGKFRYKENNRKLVLIVQNKKKILSQLDSFAINHATLFPEIECVAEYIKNKYV